MSDTEDKEDTQPLARALGQIRDEVIRECNRMAVGRSGGAISARWTRNLSSACTSAVGDVIPDIIDETIGTILSHIDDGRLQLAISTSAGRWADLTKSGRGELTGWYMGGEGSWRDLYSTERFADPLSGEYRR